MYCPSRLKSSPKGKFLKIRRSLRGRFLSIPTSTFWRSSTTISWSVFFRLHLDRKLCRRQWARGRFSAQMFGRGSAMMKACSITVCARKTYYNLPPGPNNLVGVLWMGLNKPGIGIHGTNNPETIGRAASHGCIRLANWDAARVKDLVSVGNTVLIF